MTFTTVDRWKSNRVECRKRISLPLLARQNEKPKRERRERGAPRKPRLYIRFRTLTSTGDDVVADATCAQIVSKCTSYIRDRTIPRRSLVRDGLRMSFREMAALLCYRCDPTISRVSRHRDKPRADIFFTPFFRRRCCLWLTYGTFRVFMIGIRDAAVDATVTMWNVISCRDALSRCSCRQRNSTKAVI